MRYELTFVRFIIICHHNYFYRFYTDLILVRTSSLQNGDYKLNCGCDERFDIAKSKFVAKFREAIG